ncbi:MAG: asparaginase [Chloroflexi bacterium]|nr:asparaginase [Chloroflexota bacterium]
MRMNDYVPLVEATRGEIVESIHYGAFCVVDSQGRMLTEAGDPHLMTYPRSSLKPLQVLRLIEEGGVETFGFTAEEIAIMCASHSGTLQHTSVLTKMHQKIGITEADLACGVHWPYDAAARDEMKLVGKQPTALNHNCSGKHTGMLAYARLKGYPLENYLDPSHPVQAAIRETLGEMVGMDPMQMPLGIDGCSAPVYGVPLRNMAQAVAILADPTGLEESRARACGVITSAMMAHPVMIAGPNQFDTDLMTSAHGKVFSKGGAEGYQIIGVMPGVVAKEAPGIGVAIKISDGDARNRARTSVGLTLLEAMGVLSPAAIRELSAYGNLPIKNWREFQVGEVRPVFDLPDFIEMWN